MVTLSLSEKNNQLFGDFNHEAAFRCTETSFLFFTENPSPPLLQRGRAWVCFLTDYSTDGFEDKIFEGY